MPAEIRLSDLTADAIAQLDGAAEHFVAAIATEIQTRARDAIHPAQVVAGVLHPSYAYDTGAMKVSVSVVTSLGSDYAANVAEAAALNPAAAFADEIQLSGPQDAAVQVPVDYAGYVEFGGAGPAQPFMTPAVESVAADAESIARELFGL